MTQGEAAPRRRRNQRGEGARLKSEVIEAAMRILDRSPNASLSLRMVAKEAGVAAPSLYRQFADVDAMMRDIVHECWQQMGAQLSAALEDVANEPPLVRLLTQMSAFVRYAMERPSRYQLLFALQTGSDSELDGPLRPAYRPILETIKAHVDVGGRLPTDDATSAALLTISLAHGRIALAHLAPARSGNMAGEVQNFVVDCLARLFGPAENIQG